MRACYWSNGTFAKKLTKLFRLPESPICASMDEWDQFNEDSKAAGPIRFWIVDRGLNKLQDFVYFPKDALESFAYYFQNRFIAKTHFMKTGLKPGKWHELDERLIHGMFTELVDYVEVQCAWRNTHGVELPWHQRIYFISNFVPWRNAELGIKHLEWETTLKQDDEWFGYSWREQEEPEAVAADRLANKQYMEPTPQAARAEIVLQLYNWWTQDRPYRPDPYLISGWTAYCDETRGKRSAEKTEEEQQRSSEALDKLHAIEKYYDDQDTQMMIKLVEIRGGLWT